MFHIYIYIFFIVVISLAAVGLMVAPENLEYYVNYIQAMDLPRPLVASTKMLFAWPFIYHLFNGVRHLVSRVRVNLQYIKMIIFGIYTHTSTL